MDRARLMVLFGGLGTVLGLVCCFTPLLPIALGAIGATSLLAFLYNDIVLLGFAALSFVILVLGVLRLKRSRS